MDRKTETEDRWAVALYDFEGDSSSKILSIRAGDIVLVSPREGKDWWPANLNGTYGFLPRNYLKLKPPSFDPHNFSSSLLSASSSLEVSKSAPHNQDSNSDTSSEEIDEEVEGEIEFEDAIALYRFNASNEEQLSFEKGERLTVVRTLGENWWFAQNAQGETGLIPFNYIQLTHEQQQDEVHQSEQDDSEEEEDSEEEQGFEEEEEEEEDDDDDDEEEELGSVAICQHDFFGRDKEELSFSKGDFLWVKAEKGVEWWLAQDDRGNTGHVPCNYLKIVNISIPTEPSAPLHQQLADEEDKHDPVTERRSSASRRGSGLRGRLRTRHSYKNELTESMSELALNELDDGKAAGQMANLLFFRVASRLGEMDEKTIASLLEHHSTFFEIKQFNAGAVIYDETCGEPEDALYLVVQGKTETTFGGKHLKVLPPGQWFGGGGFGPDTVASPVGFRILDDATLIVFPHSGFESLQTSFPAFANAMILLASWRSSVKMPSTLTRFSRLPPIGKEVLMRLFSFKEFQTNEIVLRQGDKCEELFMVVAGEAHMPEQNSYLRKGDVFGEECLLNGDPCPSSVVVTKGLVVLSISSEDLVSFVDCVPGAQDVIGWIGWKKSVQALSRIPLFESVPRNRLSQIAKLCKYKSFSQGETIVRQGEEGTAFYIIDTGTVEVDVPSTRAGAGSSGEHAMSKLILGPSEYFGEIAILHQDVRSATVTVKSSPCRCMVLDGPSFRAFLVDCPQIKRDIVEKVTRRLRRASLETKRIVRQSSRSLAPISSSSSSPVETVLNVDAPGGFVTEPQEMEWIIAPIESLADISTSQSHVRDQEGMDAFTEWEQVGHMMRDCHVVFDSWPVYIYPESRQDLMAPPSKLLIKVIGLDEQIRETTVMATTDNSVAEVVSRVFQNARKTGRVIDPIGSVCYALKIQSQNDFLVYRDIPLRQYKAIARVCRGEGPVHHVSMSLVDLRNVPSSNGSGVHALKFAKTSRGRRGSRASSVDSDYTITSSMLTSEDGEEDSKQPQKKEVTEGRPEQQNRDTDQAGELLDEDDDLIGIPPPPPPEEEEGEEEIEVGEEVVGVPCEGPSDLRELPGYPRISPEEWAKLMLDVTKRALAVKEVWQEVNRETCAAVQGDWPFRLRIVGVQDTQFLGSKADNVDMLCLRLQLVYASQVLETKFSNSFKPDGYSTRLEEWVWFHTPLASLPLTTRLCVTLLDLSRCSSNSSMDLLQPQVALAPFPATEVSSPVHGSGKETPIVLAGASIQLYDQRHLLRQGLQECVLWPGRSAEKRIFCVNSPLESSARLVLHFDKFLKPMYYELPPAISKKDPDASSMSFRSRWSSASSFSSTDEGNSHQQTPTKMLSSFTTVDGLTVDTKPHTSSKGHKRSPSSGSKKSGILSRLKWGSLSPSGPPDGEKRRTRQDTDIPPDVSDTTFSILMMDALQVYHMSRSDRMALWNDRHKLLGLPDALPRLLFAVDWTKPEQRLEALALVGEWKTPGPFQALELLDCVQGDYRIREYAVRCLEAISDDELLELLIQLTQVIKYEPYHQSPLVRFLLRRAWQNPREVGTRLFWSLRAEMHDKVFSQRFGLILETYLRNSSPTHLQDLTQQVDVQNLLRQVAGDVAKGKFSSKVERLNFVREELTKVNERLPGSFQLCFDPRIVLKEMLVPNCKVMNSKKKPLWLRFASVDPLEGGGESTLVMFKCGDDLRQDQMTLQMLRIMNQLWLQEGLDLRMTLYSCISTGDELGFLEIVTNADTIADIQKKNGKLGALSARSIRTWLQDCNAGKDFTKVVDNFVRSCAGYCVATYVMGIGDRHADNIMMKRDGRLFHIDFGHFLGHFKSKFGVRRERTPFVFTKEMAFVMGGKGDKPFQAFVELCCRAYNILRRHGNHLINLFRLMVPAGMPELSCVEDIQYMCEKLALDKTDSEAAETFKREIDNSLSDTYRRFDNVIHNLKTG